MVAIVYDSNTSVRGLDPFNAIEISGTPAVSGGTPTTSTGTNADASYSLDGYTSVINDIQLDVLQPAEFDNPVFTSMDQAVATVDQSGYVTGVGAGTAKIQIDSGGQLKTYRSLISTSNAYSDYAVTSYTSGWLPEHIETQVFNLLNGETPGDDAGTFWSSNNGDVTSPSATINANLYASSIDFSAMSCMRSGMPDDRFPLALVTNRHALIARHVKPGIGSTIIWKRSDGTYQTAEVEGVYDISDGTDLSVIYLDRAVTGITPFDVMPADWETTYAPSHDTASLQANVDPNITGIPQGGIPIIRKSMHNLSGSWRSFLTVNLFSKSLPSNKTFNFFPQWNSLYDRQGDFDPWSSRGNSGDSGGSMFFIINGSPVFIGSVWTKTGAAAPWLYISEINTAMDTLASAAPGTYTLSAPNLSSFTTT